MIYNNSSEQRCGSGTVGSVPMFLGFLDPDPVQVVRGTDSALRSGSVPIWHGSAILLLILLIATLSDGPFFEAVIHNAEDDQDGTRRGDGGTVQRAGTSQQPSHSGQESAEHVPGLAGDPKVSPRKVWMSEIDT